MSISPQSKLSVSLALEALKNASDRVRALEDELEEARRVRDEMIADAVQSIPITRISRITKLSRQYIYRISPGKEYDT